MTDTLANAFNAMKVAETRGKTSAELKPASRMLRSVLDILQQNGFIESYRFVDDGLSGRFAVQLSGKINECKTVKPRLAVKSTDWEKYESRFLPAAGMGILIVSTSKGVMAHAQAKQAAIGGRLLAFVY